MTPHRSRPVRPSRYALLLAGLCGVAGTHAVMGQSAISWGASQATSGIGDISTTPGGVLYALNGGSGDFNVGGINFLSSDFSDLPTGVSFTATGASAGNTPGGGKFGSVYSPSSISSTGNAAYDSLLETIAYSNGSPSGISTGHFSFSGLTPGNDYQVQVWYNEQRSGLDSRVMRFGDGLGNNVDLAGGNASSGVQTSSYGRNVTGTFTASGTSQNLSLESLGFGNVHYNAILVQDFMAPPPPPPPTPLDPRDTPGWSISTQAQWSTAIHADGSQFSISGGAANPTQSNAVFESRIQPYARKQKFTSITFEQTPEWGPGKWQSSGNLGGNTESDGPVFVSPAQGEYYYFNKVSGSYRAWYSEDMENWQLLNFNSGVAWATSAEYQDGTIYLYYDSPNDKDPNLMTLTFNDPDNRVPDQWTVVDHGQVLDTQSYGSDMAIYRDLDGSFHIIHEDWQGIRARSHSWDSQYAGHSSSPDGINGFVAHEHTAPIDLRGEPALDQFGQPIIQYYDHPHFNVPGNPNGDVDYQVYQAEQNGEPLHAWGDYELLRVGDTFYLFADDDLEGNGIGLGYWYSDDLYGAFTYGGRIRNGLHPDPGGGFATFGTGNDAEDLFVLFVQGNPTGNGQDLTSTGPWVEGVEAQAGVDTDGDGEIDVWTDWQDVSESYGRIDGFAKAYSVDPATLDLSGLPEGYAIQFRIRAADAAAIFDSVLLDSAFALPADLDGDNDVDDADFGLAFAAFTGPDSGPPSNPFADLDGDGDVDDADFGLAFAAFTGPSSAANVPEPAAVSLLAFGVLGCLNRRRRMPSGCL